MIVVFAAAFGQNLGEDGLGHGAAGLFDQVVRVPLVVQPAVDALHAQVDAQVRLMDIPNTIKALLRIDQDDDIESGDLTAFMDGTQSRDYATFLLGQTSQSIERGSVFGYRAAKSGGAPGEMLKFIWNPGLNKHWLFDLPTDPFEAADMSLSQAVVVEQMQAQVRKELGSAATEGAQVTGLRARDSWMHASDRPGVCVGSIHGSTLRTRKLIFGLIVAGVVFAGGEWTATRMMGPPLRPGCSPESPSARCWSTGRPRTSTAKVGRRTYASVPSLRSRAWCSSVLFRP